MASHRNMYDPLERTWSTRPTRDTLKRTLSPRPLRRKPKRSLAAMLVCFCAIASFANASAGLAEKELEETQRILDDKTRVLAAKRSWNRKTTKFSEIEVQEIFQEIADFVYDMVGRSTPSINHKNADYSPSRKFEHNTHEMQNIMDLRGLLSHIREGAFAKKDRIDNALERMRKVSQDIKSIQEYLEGDSSREGMIQQLPTLRGRLPQMRKAVQDAVNELENIKH